MSALLSKAAAALADRRVRFGPKGDIACRALGTPTVLSQADLRHGMSIDTRSL
jgi:hypothetical protein